VGGGPQKHCGRMRDHVRQITAVCQARAKKTRKGKAKGKTDRNDALMTGGGEVGEFEHGRGGRPLIFLR